MRDRLIELISKFKRVCNQSCDGLAKSCTRCVEEQLADYILADGWIRPPCKVGDWIWYVYRNEINKAKVEETSYDASKHGSYSYSFVAYAYDFKNKREIAYRPTNETQKNKANINSVEGMDFDEEVFIFLTREEAEKALKGGVTK